VTDGNRPQNRIDNLSVEPDRNRVKKAYAVLRTISKYTMLEPDTPSGCNHRSFNADFLYAMCTLSTVNKANEEVKSEVPLYSVQGKEGVEYEVTFPTISTTFNELISMRLEDASDITGAPLALQMQSQSVDSIKKEMSDPMGCSKALTKLDFIRQRLLKKRIHNRLRNNTPAATCRVALPTFIPKIASRQPQGLHAR